MGEAIVRGALACGVLQPSGVVVADPSADRRRVFDGMQVHTTDSIATCIRHFAEMWPNSMTRGAILLAVKPQMMEGVAQDLSPAIRGHFQNGIPVLSILAGTPLARLHDMLGTHARLVRAMPNLPARIRQGATALCFGPTATDEDRSLARKLFESVGPTVVSIDESLMDAFTALAGSGPAYLFYLAEAMMRAARELGFDDATAARLVRQTLLGSAMLLAESCDDPSVLRAAVTSKGGTTAAAVDRLDHAGALQTWIDAMRAARDRGAQLARGA